MNWLWKFCITCLLLGYVIVASPKALYRSLDQLVQNSDLIVLGKVVDTKITTEENRWEARKILWYVKVDQLLALRNKDKFFNDSEQIQVCIYDYLANGNTIAHTTQSSLFFLWKMDDCYVLSGQSRGVISIVREKVSTWDIPGQPEEQSISSLIGKIQKRSKVLWKKPRKKLDSTMNFG